MMAYLDYEAMHEWKEYIHEPTVVRARLKRNSDEWEVDENGSMHTVEDSRVFYKMFSEKTSKEQVLIDKDVLDAIQTIFRAFSPYSHEPTFG
jgi:hypothetical protein